MSLNSHRDQYVSLCKEIKRNSFQLNPFMERFVEEADVILRSNPHNSEWMNEALVYLSGLIEMISEDNEKELEFLSRFHQTIEDWVYECEFVEGVLHGALVEK